MNACNETISIEAQALVKEMVADGIDIPIRESIEKYRFSIRNGSKLAVVSCEARFDGTIKDIEVDGIPCKQLTPKSWKQDNGYCIQYAFGGGYVSGGVFEDQIITIPLAQYSAARVVMVDYRLSPEHPFPEPQQDMQRVYSTLLTEYGADRLIVSGESAGGNQAVGLLQWLRDQGIDLPRCAVLLSPWVDLANQGDSHIFNDNRDPTLNNAWVESAARMHAGSEPLESPGISPVYGDMQGLPPCIITTGSRDLLLSQCLRLSQALRAAGVECDLRVWEGMWHVFEYYQIPEAKSSIIEMAEFIKAHCH